MAPPQAVVVVLSFFGKVAPATGTVFAGGGVPHTMPPSTTAALGRARMQYSAHGGAQMHISFQEVAAGCTEAFSFFLLARQAVMAGRVQQRVRKIHAQRRQVLPIIRHHPSPALQAPAFRARPPPPLAGHSFSRHVISIMSQSPLALDEIQQQKHQRAPQGLPKRPSSLPARPGRELNRTHPRLAFTHPDLPSPPPAQTVAGV